MPSVKRVLNAMPDTFADACIAIEDRDVNLFSFFCNVVFFVQSVNK